MRAVRRRPPAGNPAPPPRGALRARRVWAPPAHPLPPQVCCCCA